MTDENRTIYVRVTDHDGSALVCPMDMLRNPGDLTREELEECMDVATVGRYAGNIDISE